MVKSTPTKRCIMLFLDDRKVPPLDITKEIGMSASQVRRILPDLRKTRDPYAIKPRPGRPQKLTAQDECRAHRKIKSERVPNATVLQRDLFPHVTPRTVQLMLCKCRLPGQVCRRKPYLFSLHKLKWRDWVNEQEKKSKEERRTIIYSDESKFNLFGSDGHHWCRREPHEVFEEWCLNLTVKHEGGKLMVWGCISWNSVG